MKNGVERKKFSFRYVCMGRLGSDHRASNGKVPIPVRVASPRSPKNIKIMTKEYKTGRRLSRATSGGISLDSRSESIYVEA